MLLDHTIESVAQICVASDADDLRHCLGNPESIFGHLVYFASLRDEAGRYGHAGLDDALGADAHQAMRAAHEQAFDEWLSLTIEHQKSDLDLYLSAFDGARKRAVFQYWARLEPHRSVIPDRAEESARALYLAGFEALLDAFASRYGEPA